MNSFPEVADKHKNQESDAFFTTANLTKKKGFILYKLLGYLCIFQHNIS